MIAVTIDGVRHNELRPRGTKPVVVVDWDTRPVRDQESLIDSENLGIPGT